MEQTLIAYLTHYGASVLFFALVLGILGLPIPDELLMTVAGALVRHGVLNGTATMAAACAGSSSGITLSYVLGRTLGTRALHRLLRVPDDTFATAQRWFTRFGHWLLTFGYFIPGVRHVTAIAAGTAPITYSAFARAAYPGAVLWCCVFLGVGYWAGDEGTRLIRALHGHIRLGVAFIAVGTALLLVARWWYRQSR
ncbi:MAG: DedA family protein [Vicinamibacterales bacterium]